MPWVVDTCLVIDVLDADPEFGPASAQLLDDTAHEGLVLCPVSYVELAPAFLGDTARQDEFLGSIGVDWHDAWQWADTLNAHRAWDHYVALRRARHIPRRPVADVLIGAFALRYQGLLTRNVEDFRLLFPNLRMMSRSDGGPREPRGSRRGRGSAAGT